MPVTMHQNITRTNTSYYNMLQDTGYWDMLLTRRVSKEVHNLMNIARVAPILGIISQVSDIYDSLILQVNLRFTALIRRSFLSFRK